MVGELVKKPEHERGSSVAPQRPTHADLLKHGLML